MSSTISWWVILVAGTAMALLVAWLGRLAGVPLLTLVSIGAGPAGLAWLVVLVTAPWNLYFAAHRLVAEIAVSRERGITVPPARDAEAARIARRMLWFALGGHICTAAAAAMITYFAGGTVGYYVAGFYLLSTGIRPAVAYFAHLRQRIMTLTRDTTHPRDDVLSLKIRADAVAGTVRDLQVQLGQAQRGLADDLRRAESTLAGDITHTRQLLTADLARLQDAQAAARSRDDHLGHRIDQMVRRMQDTLDGLSDHQELLTGIRALVRMVRSDPA